MLTYLASRRDGIAKNLESSAQLLAEAERKLREWSRRRRASTRSWPRSATPRDAAAEAERDRILADARAAAERIQQAASAAVERELRRRARRCAARPPTSPSSSPSRLLREQVNDADRDRLLDEFIGRVEQERGALMARAGGRAPLREGAVLARARRRPRRPRCAASSPASARCSPRAPSCASVLLQPLTR